MKKSNFVLFTTYCKGKTIKKEEEEEWATETLSEGSQGQGRADTRGGEGAISSSPTTAARRPETAGHSGTLLCPVGRQQRLCYGFH